MTDALTAPEDLLGERPLDSSADHVSECLVIANPCAAQVERDLVREIADRLTSRASMVSTRWTEAPGHAADIVRAHPEAGLVVAVGGDGTVAEVVQGLAADQVLCALPAGSGNSTARNLFGELTWQQVLELLDTPGAGVVRVLDLMRIVEPGVLAVLGASTGFLAEVLVRSRAVDPSVQGLDRYYAAAVDVLQAMPDHPTRVTVDGAVLTDGPTSSVAIGGGRFRARSFEFLPNSILDDGLLDVSTIDALDPASIGEFARLLLTGDHLRRSEVRYARGGTVVVERTDGMPLVAEFDGSVWDAAGSRLTVEIVPNALRALGCADPR